MYSHKKTRTYDDDQFIEPPISARLPGWGSRARKHDAWMKKILAPPSAPALSTTHITPPQSAASSPKRAPFWNADAEFTQMSSIDTSPKLRVQNRPTLAPHAFKLEDLKRREETLTSVLSGFDLSPKKAYAPIKEASVPDEEGTSVSVFDLPPSKPYLQVEENDPSEASMSDFHVSDVDPEEQITAEKKLFDLQDKSSRSATPPIPVNVLTPRVTGAYVEYTEDFQIEKPSTPPPRAFTPPPKTSTPPAQISNPPRKVSTPYPRASTPPPKDSSSSAHVFTPSPRAVTSLPKDLPAPRPAVISVRPPTATEDLRELQRKLGDSTFEDDDLTGPLLHTEEPKSDNEVPTTVERVERMSRSMKKTRGSIRDARHGIERLEQQVSSVTATTKDSALAPATQESIDRLCAMLESLSRHSVPGNDTLLKERDDQNQSMTININLSLAIPKIWTSGSGAISRNWKLTWFGFMLVAFMTWFIAEVVMCNEFCHPYASSYSNWHPSDPFFPWAIPTKLGQWTGRALQSVGDWLGF